MSIFHGSVRTSKALLIRSAKIPVSYPHKLFWCVCVREREREREKERGRKDVQSAHGSAGRATAEPNTHKSTSHIVESKNIKVWSTITHIWEIDQF